jgi:hypothetical protein
MNNIKCSKCLDGEHIYNIYIYNGCSYCKECLIEVQENNHSQETKPSAPAGVVNNTIDLKDKTPDAHSTKQELNKEISKDYMAEVKEALKEHRKCVKSVKEVKA